MRKLELSLTALLLVAAPVLFAQTSIGCSAIESQSFNAALRSQSLGQPNALANVFLTTNALGTAKLHVRSLGLGSNITNLQLYSGGTPTTGGTLVQTFTDTSNGFAGGRLSQQLNLDQNLIAQITANPSNYYWVINTQSGSQIVGQLGGTNARTFGGTLSNASASGSGNYVFSVMPVGGGNYRLSYDINTSGLGNDFTSLTLSMPGTAPMTLAGNSTAVNGRLSGSTLLTAAQAQQLLCDTSAFSLGLNGANGSLSGGVSTANEVFIPIAGSARGANGANWKTDLTMFNTSDASTSSSSVRRSVSAVSGSANTVVQFYPAGDQNVGMLPASNSLTIAPRGMSATRDISSNLFDNNGLGGVRIISSSNIIANARLYNDQTANGHGTFGQYVSGLARSQAISAGLIAGLATTMNGNSQAAQHSNVAFFNPSDSYVPVSLELRDANGNVTGTRTLTLPPYQMVQQQLIGSNGLFSNISDSVSNSSMFFVSGSPIFALGSVVDDVSGDTTVVEAQSDENLSD